jgi:hypothetical protein
MEAAAAEQLDRKGENAIGADGYERERGLDGGFWSGKIGRHKCDGCLMEG